MSLRRTPSQTIGPFFAVGMPWADGPFVVPEGTKSAVWIRGQVFDGDSNPVPDSMIETWQADPEGRFDHPADERGAVAGFRGFGRSCTDADGSFEILTLKPGPVPGPDGAPQAPHIDISVFARGLLKRAVTRLYFPDEVDANAADPTFGSLSPEARSTVMAERADDGYRFDIRLQGERETTFFDV